MNPVQNYLNGLVEYYHPTPQHAAHHHHGPGGYAPNLMPALALGGNIGRGGVQNLHVVGGADVLDRVRAHQKEDREEERASSAAWIGAVLTIIGSAGLACVMSDWSEIRERLEVAREFKEEQLPLIPDGGDKAQLIAIVNRDIKILEKKNSRARNIVILTGIALASAATAFAAGMFAIQWLITTSIVVGVATLAVGAFAAVYYSRQKFDPPEGIREYLQAHQGY